VTKEEIRRVLIVQLDLLLPKQEASNANPVGLAHMARDAKRVPKDNTAAAVTLSRSCADIARGVITTTTLVRVLVCPAFL
jgi:hypothetical protein